MDIAVWYHCKICGIGIPSRTDSIEIVREQMIALNASGLADAASEIHIGINGGIQDASNISELCPPRATVYLHGEHSRSELPTFSSLRLWLPEHPSWFVFYHHSKGVTQPNDSFHVHHRRTMEKYLVWSWRKCVSDLESGYEAVGINLVHPEKRPVLPGRFFAGNFWWATAAYLLRLPVIPDSVTTYNDAQRCIAEGWVGSAKGEPKFMDYERPELYVL